MKLATKGFERDEHGRMYRLVQAPFNIGFAELHLAASMVPGVTTAPESVTVSQVLSSLHQIMLSVGGNYQEIMWDTPDAREIKDFYRREAVNAIADRHAYAVVIRLWPELEGCPWAQHYFAGMEA